MGSSKPRPGARVVRFTGYNCPEVVVPSIYFSYLPIQFSQVPLAEFVIAVGARLLVA